MKIIIEGPDGAGKTTLANTFAKAFGYPIIHRDKPKTEEERLKMFDGYMASATTTENAIYDRFAYSELVYGPVMRDRSFINIQQMYELEVELAKTGAMVIFCDNSITKLWEACLDRGEKYITSITQLQDIQNMYRALFMDMTHLIPVLHYRR